MIRSQEQSSLRGRVARSIFWVTWSRGALQLVNFANTLVIARILVPADYGVMALAGFWTSTAGILADMGLGSAIIQFRNLDKREIDACFWMTMALAVLCCAVLSVSAPDIARWFAAPRLSEILPVLSLVLPLVACRVVSDSLLRQRLALDRVSQAEVIGTVVTLPVTLGCALAGFGVWALVAGALVNPAVRSIATVAFAPWRPELHIGGARMKEVIRFSLATLGVKMMWALREWGNTLVIGKITGQVAVVGLYSMAEEIALLPSSKITTVVNMLSTPVMAELQADVDAMRASFYRAMRLTAAIVLPASAGIALVADELVAVLLGPKWMSAVPILRLLCVYAGMRGVDVLLPPVLFARRRERFLFWYCLALLVLAPTAGTIGALWNGAQGTVMLATPVYFAVMTVMAREALAEMRSSVAELGAALRPIAAATAVMAVAVFLLRQLAPDALANLPLLKLFLLSASGAIVYGAALLAIGSPVTAEGAEVLDWVLRRHRAEG